MPRLNIHSNILAFADPETVTSNPKLRHVDWTTDYTQIDIVGPENKEHTLAPAETRTLFSGVRTLTVDGTTEFSLALNAAQGGVYRLSVTGGTAAGFRTTRAVAISGETLTVVANNNATVSFALAAASVPTFAAVQVGDIVFIPHTTTGDAASPFNVLNTGFWVVLARGSSGAGADRKLTCKRLPGVAFEGTSESVAVANDFEFRAFSSGPVQAGDNVVLSSGFSAVTLGTYVLKTVTDTWVEFTSGESLPLEDDILPTATGIRIYSQAKSFVRIEVDRPAYVRLNGSVGNEIALKPRVTGSATDRAHFEMWGTIWQLEVVNRSPDASMVTQLISASEAV